MITKTIQALSLFLIVVFAFSCTIEKRKYQAGYHVDWKSNRSVSDVPTSKSALSDNKKASKQAESDSPPILEPAKTIEPGGPGEYSDLEASAGDDTRLLLTKPLLSGTSTQKEINEKCDNIILVNGEEIEARVIEVGSNEIRYKKCDNPEGPDYTISKKEVLLIKYPNGSKDIISPGGIQKQEKRTPGLASAGLILGILGLLAFGLPLGLLAMIFGAVSLNKIARFPDKYKGKGVAIASIVLGAIGIIAVIILIMLVL